MNELIKKMFYKILIFLLNAFVYFSERFWIFSEFSYIF